MKITQSFIHSLLFLGIVVAVPLASAHTPYDQFAIVMEGTYSKPSNNGLSVGDQLFSAAPGGFAGNGNVLDGGRRHVFLSPDHEFDYALGFTYHFKHTHTRFFVHYDHYTTEKSQGDIDIRNIGFFPPLDTQGFAQVRENAYEFSVGFVHDLHFNRFSIDLYTFFEKDKLAQSLFEKNDQITLIYYQTIQGINGRTTENKTYGFGPGFGMRGRIYPFKRYPHCDIFAGAKTTLLYAHHAFNQTFEVNEHTFYIYESDQTTSLVGKLQILFGINYHHALKQEMHGMKWDITLGMRYMNMFNALKNGHTAFNPNAEIMFFSEHIEPENFAANLGTAQDWGRWGPFLKFKLGGADS